VRNWQTFKSEWVGKGSAKESIDQFAGVVF